MPGKVKLTSSSPSSLSLLCKLRKGEIRGDSVTLTISSSFIESPVLQNETDSACLKVSTPFFSTHLTVLVLVGTDLERVCKEEKKFAAVF